MKLVKEKFFSLHYMLQALLVVVMLPTAISALYYAFQASSIYVSEAQFAIRSNEAAATGGMLSAVIGVSGSSSTAQDTAAVKNYILSIGMLTELQNKLSIRDHFVDTQFDWLSRLKPAASTEEFLEYFQDKIEVKYEIESGIVTLKAKAFLPNVAQSMATTVLDLSEQLVNRMSNRIAEDSLQFSQRELSRAETKVRKANSALTQFRNSENTIDPDKKSGAVLGIVAELEAKLASTRTELSEARSYMREGSSQVISLKNRTKALNEQILKESQRLTGANNIQLSSLMEVYEALVLERELAQERYTTALASLEAARTEALRKQRYLITFVNPPLPDEALEPRRVWNVLTVFVSAFLIYIIGGLLWSAIKDHMGH